MDHARPEQPAGPSPTASVVLDIGPHAGALVVYTPPELAGDEIEIRPTGAAWHGEHTAVRERHAGGRVLHAGVFGSLAAGSYELRLRSPGGAGAAVSAQVSAGVVSEATWPGPGAGPGPAG